MLAYLPLLALTAVVGSGLMAGLLFAFSNFVMQTLRELPAEHGQQAMQRINVRIINPVFLLVFIGTAVACALVAIHSVSHLDSPSSGWQSLKRLALRGPATYPSGFFGTICARSWQSSPPCCSRSG
jgi:uncharacterized membrane protein